jgi:hypothetical protein
MKLGPRAVRVLRWGTAGVWLAFGLLAKVLSGVPRHRAIVARVVGEGWATPLTLAVGVVEVGIAVWILSARRPRACILVQTLLIAGMNGLELACARDLLLAPVGMILANGVFLALGWVLALQTQRDA